MKVSNGATVCCELFLYGYRRYSDKDNGIIYVFEPYDLEDINCRDWITKPSPNMFFFGSYDWNGDELYMDRESLEIVLCSTPDLTLAWIQSKRIMLSFCRNQFVRQYEKVHQNSKHYFILEGLHPDHFFVFKLLDVDVCQLWKQWR